MTTVTNQMHLAQRVKNESSQMQMHKEKEILTTVHRDTFKDPKSVVSNQYLLPNCDRAECSREKSKQSTKDQLLQDLNVQAQTTSSQFEIPITAVTWHHPSQKSVCHEHAPKSQPNFKKKSSNITYIPLRHKGVFRDD